MTREALSMTASMALVVRATRWFSPPAMAEILSALEVVWPKMEMEVGSICFPTPEEKLDLPSSSYDADEIMNVSSKKTNVLGKSPRP